MKTEEQRIAIAEACGWTKISDWKAAGINGQHPTEPWTEVIPDYLNDLNAMHEAVKTLPQNIKPRYFACLCFVVRGAISLNGYSKATEATAAQRAEAFLRTIDKWTTNPNEL
jgi:hypothetical protein